MKVLFSDFDNTIFFLNDENTTKKNVESIKDFINQGNMFCLITGRTYTDIKNELIKLDLPYTYLICGDGALIFDNLDYCLQRTTLDRGVAERVVERINDELMVYAYASRVHINVNNPINNKRDAIKNIIKLTNIPTKDIYVIGDSINDYEMLEAYNSAVVKKIIHHLIGYD